MDWQELNPQRYKLLTGAAKLLTFDEKKFRQNHSETQVVSQDTWIISEY